MKKMLVMITMILLSAMLSGCGRKTILMENVIQAESLEAEPAEWISEDAITMLTEAKLPAELQREYMNLVGRGCTDIFMKDSEGWIAEVKSDGDGIYVGKDLKFFQSSSGNVVEIGRSWRTIHRTEYFDGEKRNAYDSIDLDVPEDSNLIRIAVTNDFSVVYNVKDNTYQCMQLREIIGTSEVTNLDAAMKPESVPTQFGANKGFMYAKEMYVPVIEKEGGNTIFYIVKQSELEQSDSISYVDMKIGTLETRACVIER